jgi:hypothetical protein
MSTPDFTSRWYFWPLIALIALLFVLTMVMAVNAANRAADQEALVNGSCAPAFLRQYDAVTDGSAALPTLGDVDAMLDQINPVDAAEAGACAAP